jgi:hypothetical protein
MKLNVTKQYVLCRPEIVRTALFLLELRSLRNLEPADDRSNSFPAVTQVPESLHQTADPVITLDPRFVTVSRMYSPKARPAASVILALYVISKCPAVLMGCWPFLPGLLLLPSFLSGDPSTLPFPPPSRNGKEPPTFAAWHCLKSHFPPLLFPSFLRLATQHLVKTTHPNLLSPSTRYAAGLMIPDQNIYFYSDVLTRAGKASCSSKHEYHRPRHATQV